jgi:hypothetical protein
VHVYIPSVIVCLTSRFTLGWRLNGAPKKPPTAGKKVPIFVGCGDGALRGDIEGGLPPGEARSCPNAWLEARIIATLRDAIKVAHT